MMAQVSNIENIYKKYWVGKIEALAEHLVHSNIILSQLDSTRPIC